MDDEELRVLALKNYQILDKPSDEHLDSLTQLTARLCEVPVALISLVDKHRQWAKSISGVRIYEETPREMSFCDLTIGGDEIFEVKNTEENDHFRDNPLVTASPRIRFYAGAPLITPSGHKIGSLCVLDMVPRRLTPEQRDRLQEMSRVVMNELESRQTLNCLKDSEAQLTDLVDNTTDLIQSVSPEGRIHFVNRTWMETLGYTKSELSSMNIFDVIHPDCQAHCGALFQRLMNGEDVGLIEVVFQAKDGHPIPLEGRITVRMEHGQPIATRAIFRDVTERKRAQKELEAREFSYRRLINNIPGAVYRCSNNLNWEMSFLSPAIEEITGFAPAEFLDGSLDYASLVHKDELPYLRETRIELLRQKNFFIIEYRLFHRDGSIRWVYEQGRVNPINESELEGVIFDITDRKLIEQKEAEARKEAEAANLAKSNFLSRMSHELRTPLNSIIGFSKILEMAGLPDKQTHNAQRISNAGNHLLSLINEVLDLSRIEAEGIDTLSKGVKIETLVDEVILLVNPMARERGINITRKACDTPDLRALVDRQHLLQALLNLASNGIKYNRQKGTLSFEVKITSSGRVRIEVRDTGEGIPKDKFSRLFIPFDRLDVEISRPSVEGSGLGLSLTKKLVEAMRGEISFRSELGKGSVFVLEFDQAENDGSASKHCDEIQAHGIESKKPDVFNTGKNNDASLTILYIEDNQDNIELVEQVIEFRERVHMLTAIQGGQGVDLARLHHPDIIFLDFHLPDLNGDEVLQLLQRGESTRNIPVYVLSADAMPKQIERLRGLGVVDYLTKPLDVDFFLAILDERLAKKNNG